jgi:hypothetical protein
MSRHLWEVCHKAWHLKLPFFGLDRVLPLPKNLMISFGFFFRVTSESAKSQVTSLAMVRS